MLPSSEGTVTRVRSALGETVVGFVKVRLSDLVAAPVWARSARLENLPSLDDLKDAIASIGQEGQPFAEIAAEGMETAHSDEDAEASELRKRLRELEAKRASKRPGAVRPEESPTGNDSPVLKRRKVRGSVPASAAAAPSGKTQRPDPDDDEEDDGSRAAPWRSTVESGLDRKMDQYYPGWSP